MELIQRQINTYQLTQREEFTEVTLEAIVPDSMTDVVRTVGGYAYVSIKDKSIQTDRLIIGGTVDVQVLCITETNVVGEILPVTIPLSHIITAPGCTGDSIAHIYAESAECNVVIVNSRKIGVRVKVKMASDIYNPNMLQLSQSMRDCGDIHTLKKPFKTTCITAATEKQIRIVESIPVTTPMLKPIRYETEFITEDMKVLKNKMMARGCCQLRVFFLNCQSGETVREKYHLPFTCVVENDCIDEEVEVKVDYQCKWAQLELKDTGTGCALVCDICADMAITATTVVEEEILVDAFSCNYETQLKWCDANYYQTNQEETIKQELCYTWETVEDAARICDYSTCHSYNYTEGGKLYADITANVTYRDNAGDVYCKVLKADFELQTECCPISVRMKLENVVISCTESGHIKLDADATWCMMCGAKGVVKQLESCRLMEDTPKAKKNNATLILRNVSENETIWDVAKRYSTSPDAIWSANKLEPMQPVVPGTLIMIPIVK